MSLPLRLGFPWANSPLSPGFADVLEMLSPRPLPFFPSTTRHFHPSLSLDTLSLCFFCRSFSPLFRFGYLSPLNAFPFTSPPDKMRISSFFLSSLERLLSRLSSPPLFFLPLGTTL